MEGKGQGRRIRNATDVGRICYSELGQGVVLMHGVTGGMRTQEIRQRVVGE